jgi:hypothetical protein
LACLWTANNTGSTKYFKILNANSNIREYVYFIQARAGEFILLSTGFGDGSAYTVPKARRLLDTYSKIAGMKYYQSSIYLSVSAYSHDILFSQITGNVIANISLSEVTKSEYDSASTITIE